MNATKSGSGNLTAALNDAQAIIDAAEQRAQEIRNAAAKAFEEAKQTGYSAGLAQGAQEAANTAVRLLEQGGSVEAKLAEEAAKLALAICKTVIGEAVKVDPALVRKVAERALQQSIVGDTVTIFVHPDDAEQITSALDHLRRLSGGAKVLIETDSMLTRGGCLVRTEYGEVDASIELLLGSVAQRLGLPTP